MNLPIMLNQKSKGFAVAASLFLIVVLSLMGSVVWRLVSDSSIQTIQDIENTKALNAAKAGIEYGLYQSSRNNQCQNASVTFPDLPDFLVDLKCTRSTTTESGMSYSIDSWTSTACNRSTCPSSVNGGYIERQLVAQIIVTN